MVEIRVDCKPAEFGWICEVELKNRKILVYKVFVNKEDYGKLAKTRQPVQDLVKASFRFLLDREPKESILRSFDLMLISKYFPEYKKKISDYF